jgi:hypothetical protein
MRSRIRIWIRIKVKKSDLYRYGTGIQNYLISGAGEAEYNARSLASPVHHQVQVTVLHTKIKLLRYVLKK